MKVTVATILVALVWALSESAAAQSTYPDVRLDYKPLFDPACGEVTKQPVEPAAMTELQSRLDGFREIWRKDAPLLLGAVPTVTGVPFSFHEARAALFLCSAFRSVSLPLMINMRSYVSATANGKVGPAAQFTNSVFHEVLHRYVDEIVEALPGKTTPLLEKYRSEPQPVRNHLHLFAIEALVYRRLGREQDLEAPHAAIGPVAMRALEIVAIEKAENIVRELR